MEDNDNNSKEKLSKNTARLVGISALRQIRSLVDGYEQQDRNNKRNASILIITLLILGAAFIVFMICTKQETITLPIDPDSSLTKPS